MKKPFASLLVILVICVVSDQVTKQWAQKTLLNDTFFEKEGEYPVCGNRTQSLNRERFIAENRESQSVIDGFFNFRYVENCASAFGLMGRVPESFRFPFFLVVSVLALFFIPYLYRQTPVNQPYMLYGLPFILGGAIGNLLDRLIYRYVIDFIEWYVTIGDEAHRWPTFNIADAAIVIGIGLMLIQMLPMNQPKEAEKKEQ